MKQQKKNAGKLLTVNAVGRRVLKVMRKAPTKRSTRWTPFEGIPESVSVGELRRREAAG